MLLEAHLDVTQQCFLSLMQKKFEYWNGKTATVAEVGLEERDERLFLWRRTSCGLWRRVVLLGLIPAQERRTFGERMAWRNTNRTIQWVQPYRRILIPSGMDVYVWVTNEKLMAS